LSLPKSLMTKTRAHLRVHVVIRGALPLGLPDSVARSPLRRLAPLRWLVRDAHSRPPAYKVGCDLAHDDDDSIVDLRHQYGEICDATASVRVEKSSPSCVPESS